MKKLFIYIVLFSISINLFAQQTGKEIEIKGFTGLKLEGSGTVYLIPSDTNKLFVDMKSCDVINYLDIKNQGVNLIINTTSKNKNLAKTFSKLVFYVYCKNLNSVIVEGKGKIVAKDTLKADIFAGTLKGSGSLNLILSCNFFRGTLNGTGNIHVHGNAYESKVEVNGVGVYKALDFETKKTNVSVDGVGSAYVYVSEYLKASLSGVGSIKYLGNPKDIKCNTSGLGTVKAYK